MNKRNRIKMLENALRKQGNLRPTEEYLEKNPKEGEKKKFSKRSLFFFVLLLATNILISHITSFVWREQDISMLWQIFFTIPLALLTLVFVVIRQVKRKYKLPEKFRKLSKFASLLVAILLLQNIFLWMASAEDFFVTRSIAFVWIALELLVIFRKELPKQELKKLLLFAAIAPNIIHFTQIPDEVVIKQTFFFGVVPIYDFPISTSETSHAERMFLAKEK